ncbi:unnamed protein product [Haemonchus placei]|uniref:Cylicin_N domain-containing protein n=1 Tax=Haemonchus placei TaxID=6290 RepID=A0A0N4X233_HAEPC|nr:unnamed protein product [Haemonchus placei]
MSNTPNSDTTDPNGMNTVPMELMMPPDVLNPMPFGTDSTNQPKYRVRFPISLDCNVFEINHKKLVSQYSFPALVRTTFVYTVAKVQEPNTEKTRKRNKKSPSQDVFEKENLEEVFGDLVEVLGTKKPRQGKKGGEQDISGKNKMEEKFETEKGSKGKKKSLSQDVSEKENLKKKFETKKPRQGKKNGKQDIPEKNKMEEKFKTEKTRKGNKKRFNQDKSSEKKKVEGKVETDGHKRSKAGPSKTKKGQVFHLLF